MRYNLYKFTNENQSFNLLENNHIEGLIEKLNVFQEEVINEYENAQFGRKGIKSLGNKIKFNKKISEQVFSNFKNISLVKVTGNRKTFLNDFLKILSDKSETQKIYFFVYSPQFRKESSIVDSTSTSISDINSNIKLLFNAFKNLSLSNEMYVVEVKSLKSCHFVTDAEGFTRLIRV